MMRVVHFEIPAVDPNRLAQFLTAVFGWQIKKWEGMDYWLVTTGEQGSMGIDGAIQPGKSAKDCGIVLTIDVEDIDAMEKEVNAHGGHTEGKKDHIPQVGWFLHFTDTEGNLWGMLQPDPDMMK